MNLWINIHNSVHSHSWYCPYSIHDIVQWLSANSHTVLLNTHSWYWPWHSWYCTVAVCLQLYCTFEYTFMILDMTFMILYSGCVLTAILFFWIHSYDIGHDIHDIVQWLCAYSYMVPFNTQSRYWPRHSWYCTVAVCLQLYCTFYFIDSSKKGSQYWGREILTVFMPCPPLYICFRWACVLKHLMVLNISHYLNTQSWYWPWHSWCCTVAVCLTFMMLYSGCVLTTVLYTWIHNHDIGHGIHDVVHRFYANSCTVHLNTQSWYWPWHSWCCTVDVCLQQNCIWPKYSDKYAWANSADLRSLIRVCTVCYSVSIL